MTLADVLALVAGVAVSYAVATGLPEGPFVRTPWLQLVFTSIRFLQGTTLAIAVVALVRVGVYRRMPTGAEWLAILVGSTLLTEWPYLQVDSWVYAYRGAFATLDTISLNAVRWLAAGLFLAPMAIGLGVIQVGRRHFPTWFKTLLLAWEALLAMSGPLQILGEHGADLISPSQGFGPGTASTLHRGACGLAAWLPMGLLFGLPATAGLIERAERRSWTWVEWAAVVGSILTLGFAMATYHGEFAASTPAGIAERVLVLVWFLTIIVLSRLILICFSEAWSRWIAAGAGQDRSSSSVLDSTESIRST